MKGLLIPFLALAFFSAGCQRSLYWDCVNEILRNPRALGYVSYPGSRWGEPEYMKMLAHRFCNE